MNVLLSGCINRDYSRARKEGRRMICDCVPPSSDEKGAVGCDEDCLNRMLLIEWSVQ